MERIVMAGAGSIGCFVGDLLAAADQLVLSEDPACPEDAMPVTVKTGATASMAAEIAVHAPADVPVVSLQNGPEAIDAEARISMACDVAAGRQTEIDALQGTIVALGQAQGVPTPICAHVAALIVRAEPGVALSPDDLRP